MAAFVIRRVVAVVPVLVIVSVLVFSLVALLPGDPAQAIAGGPEASPERVEQVRQELKLDDPILQRYGDWALNVLRFDFGESLYTSRSVSTEISSRFPVTLSVAGGAIVVTLVLGVASGVAAALNRNTWVDRAVIILVSAGMAIPSFWLALILLVVFGVELGWFRGLGYTPFLDSPLDWARDLVLPWLALGIGGAAAVARQVRGATIDVLHEDYIRTARSKGVPERWVIAKHVMKNSLTPAVTVMGVQFAYLLGGTVIIESIFSLPGLGTYMIGAISGRDVPVIQGVVMLSALIFVTVNLLVDIAYGLLNPKVRAR